MKIIDASANTACPYCNGVGLVGRTNYDPQSTALEWRKCKWCDGSGIAQTVVIPTKPQTTTVFSYER